MLHRILVFFFLFASFYVALAEEQQTYSPPALIDSLITSFEKADHVQKYKLAETIIPACLKGDEVVSVLPVHNKMSDDEINLMVFFAADRFYYNVSDFKKCIDYIERTLQLTAREDNLTDDQRDIRATALADKAYILFKLSQMEEATEAATEAVKYAKQHNNLLQLSRAYLYHSIVNYGLRRPDEAIEFVELAIATNNKLGLNNNTHNTYGIACEIYSFAQQMDKAIEYGEKAVETAEKVGSFPGAVNHLSQLSYAYNRQGDYQKGLEMAQQAIDMVNEKLPEDRNLLAISMVYKAHNLLDLKRYPEAADVLREAIAIDEELGNTRAVIYDHKALCEALSHFDEHGELIALRRYSRMADSLHMADLNEALGKANAELRNDELKEDNEEKDRYQHRMLLLSVIIGAVLLSAIGFLIYAMRLKSKSNKTLLELQHARESFFTNITHELRTPLTLILGLVDKIKQNQSPAPTRQTLKTDAESIEIIQREGNQLLNLINQLLDISKVKAGMADPQWTHADIVTYINMMVETYQQLANQKGIEILYAPNEKELMMDFVPDYAQKVIGNLIANAIKFTPDYGHVYLTTETDNEYLHLTIADTGPGIPSQYKKHVFDPFFQGNTEGADTGTGIGLSLVKQIVDAVKGTIELKSAEGKGTVFMLRLPLTNPLTAQSGKMLRSTVADEKDAHSKDSSDNDIQRILIVEDNRDVAYYIGSSLQGNYEIDYANNGRVGLDKAEHLVPHLIITDLMMPEMDGIELCKRIRQSEITSHIPIIVITAKATEKERVVGIEAGADAYLFKPFNADELNARVRNLLEQRRTIREKILRSISDNASPDKDDLLNSNELSDADRKFLGRITDLVFSMMKNGAVDIDSLASHLFMTPSQFRRKFTSVTGQKPAAYILNIRLSNAKRMLDANPELTISQVAERCGFADASHFSNAFKRQFGITPSQYIKRVK